MKATTLESKFPLLAVENGCIVSKEADVTVAFKVELPELFSVTGSEYEAIHSAWHKAVKVLPDYSIVHKQDSAALRRTKSRGRNGPQASWRSTSLSRRATRRY